MKAQWQDGVDPAPGAGLDLGEAVDVPRIEHQRLLADRVAVRAQSKAHMGVVQVVGRADADIVDALTAATQLIDMAVAALEFGDAVGLGKMAVHRSEAHTSELQSLM